MISRIVMGIDTVSRNRRTFPSLMFLRSSQILASVELSSSVNSMDLLDGLCTTPTCGEFGRLSSFNSVETCDTGLLGRSCGDNMILALPYSTSALWLRLISSFNPIIFE